MRGLGGEGSQVARCVCVCLYASVFILAFFLLFSPPVSHAPADVDKFCVSVRITEGDRRGTVLDGVEYEDVSKLA